MKDQPQSFTTDITDKEDLDEIKQICHMLNPNEEIFVVARQSRLKPSGSTFTLFGILHDLFESVICLYHKENTYS